MTEDKSTPRQTENIKQEEIKEEHSTAAAETGETKDVEKIEKELSELKDKYLRLYADFENYKRLVVKEKEEIIKYSNEELIGELLSVIDHLELALQHSSNNNSLSASALAEGVQMTLKELKTILEKFGIVSIEALGKPFDPFIHHAMSQIETDEGDENMVVKEFRKGYMLRDRVLRASLVGVSKKPSQEVQETETKEEE
jgi:molecular chaperone GrpE